MAFETQIGEMMREDTIDSNKILNDLLSEKNIDLKTHIVSPIDFAILSAVVDNLEPLLFKKSNKKINLEKSFLVYLKKYLISWNRLSRKEITETLKATKEQEIGERSIFSRLTGMDK